MASWQYAFAHAGYLLGIRFSRYGRGSPCGAWMPQWRLRDSNSRPPACKAGALPAELSPLDLGSRLLSHAVPGIVPSAAYVLTFVFGMGTGVSRKRIATGKLVCCLFLFRHRHLPLRFPLRVGVAHSPNVPYAANNLILFCALHIRIPFLPSPVPP